jgi:hypothetical protein
VPTFGVSPRFEREYRGLSASERRAFDTAWRRLAAGLRERPPAFEPALRVKRVRGTSGVWELTWAPDGRATFEYGAERRAGEAHIVWRRIGSHRILEQP